MDSRVHFGVEMQQESTGTSEGDSHVSHSANIPAQVAHLQLMEKEVAIEEGGVIIDRSGGEIDVSNMQILESWREARIHSKLQCHNIVSFHGVVQDEVAGISAIVTEFMVDGSLRNVLLKKDRNLDHCKRLIIAVGAASGMEYLHCENIIHFDLRCDNLFVDLKDPSHPICKVGGFGLSQIKSNTLALSGTIRGIIPWIAPELLNGSSDMVSEKVDVFSFGIVMWEILTGEEPYGDMHFGQIIGGILSNKLRPPVPASCDPEWRRLMEECWDSDPQQRPSFTEIVNRLNLMPLAGQTYRDNKKIIKNEDLEELRELGSGTFGTVYHGKWGDIDVAIKRLNKSSFRDHSFEQERPNLEFWQEVEILSNLQHPNVVAFYGVVQDGPGDTLATVTEFMVDGSLGHALLCKDKCLDYRKRLIIAMDAAFGMEYLHYKNIVHFDLKSDNLLVNFKDQSRPICKVADFGLSKNKQDTPVSGSMRGTLPWMAPELLNGSSDEVSEKVDVYSFGIVMWEILTGEEPYADMHYGEIIGGIVNNTLRPPVPASCDPEWRGLMEQCWAPNPQQRPSFTQIVSTLRSMS